MIFIQICCYFYKLTKLKNEDFVVENYHENFVKFYKNYCIFLLNHGIILNMKVRKFIIYIIVIINLILPSVVCATEINGSATTEIDVYAPSAILIEKETGDILYEKDAYSQRYPASTVKIMTAILALENSNLLDTVTISQKAISAVPSGYTVARLQPNEILTVENLLYATLVPSGNDAANALAEYIGGNISDFATMMNNKAKEIGCKNTNFTNPNGVHDNNMYTTSYDLALIAQYAMKNEIFRKIVSTPTYTLPSSNVYSESDRVLKNSNHLIDTKSKHYYEYATGIKTGYTNPAQNCLVAGANKDGVELIAVILGSTAGNTGNQAKFVDAKNLFEYGFEKYSDYYINLANTKKQSINNDLLNSVINTEMLQNENHTPRWGYIFYLIAKSTLIIIAILYISWRFITKIKRYMYNRTHAKYNYKY